MLVTQEVQDRTKAEMQKAQETLKKDLLAIRAGRANPQLLDRISFDYYGSMTPLPTLPHRHQFYDEKKC